MSDDRLLESLSLMRRMLDAERAEVAKLRDQKERLIRLCQKHGINTGGVL